MEVVEFACGLGHATPRASTPRTSRPASTSTRCASPLGVVGIISPFNFPAMVPLWFFPIAIAAGNAVVLKPSEKDPSAAELDGGAPARRRGCPTACSTSCTATRRPSTRCSSTPTCASISFVGSTPIAQYVYETATGQRQARAGARRREEPHAGAAGRRPRPRRRRRRERGLRLGRRALHGDLGRARGRLRSPTSSSRRSPSAWRR